MMAAAPGRRRGVKILLGLLGALALGFAILLIGIEIAAGRHWKEMGNGIRSLVAEAAAHEARRPTVSGGTEPGNAWDDYLKAFDEAAARAVNFSSSVFKPFLGRAPHTD